MLLKKVLSIDRQTGELLAERYTGEADMSEERFWKPFIELYKEDMEKLAERIAKGGPAWQIK